MSPVSPTAWTHCSWTLPATTRIRKTYKNGSKDGIIEIGILAGLQMGTTCHEVLHCTNARGNLARQTVGARHAPARPNLSRAHCCTEQGEQTTQQARCQSIDRKSACARRPPHTNPYIAGLRTTKAEKHDAERTCRAHDRARDSIHRQGDAPLSRQAQDTTSTHRAC